MRKPVFWVSGKGSLKPVSSAKQASKKIEVSLVASLDMTSKKADNKVADVTARMRRLICAFVVTNHQRQFFSVAVHLLYVT